MNENMAVRVCKACGKEFNYYANPAYKNSPSRGQFCSVDCRWDFRRKTVNCETCGKDFVTYPKNKALAHRDRFCSGFCADGGTLEQRFKKQLSLGVTNETGCILCPLYKGECYSRIAFGGKPMFMHRVAYELRHGKIPDGLNVLHCCDNRACANIDHLILGTQAENQADMVSKNRQAKGSKVGRSKLTDRAVLEIRSKYKPVKGSLTNLANEYGVRRQTIMRIVKRQAWKHI